MITQTHIDQALRDVGKLEKRVAEQEEELSNLGSSVLGMKRALNDVRIILNSIKCKGKASIEDIDNTMDKIDSIMLKLNEHHQFILSRKRRIHSRRKNI